MDETGFRIGVGGSQWIITMEFKKPQLSPLETNRDFITSVEAISADGEVLPPLLIVQGINHLQQWYTNTALPDDYLIGTSPSGYSNDTLSIDWLKHFDNWSTKRQCGVYRLLIFDSYGSHLTKEFVDYCDERKIIPFSLPPHTSHNLQPYDVVVFQPFKHYHKQAVEAITRTGCTDFNKVEFLNAIDSIRLQTFKQRTILSAWEQAGLYPYNPEIVLQKLEPSRPQTPQPVNCDNATINPTTPTPKTVWSYKQWSMKL